MRIVTDSARNENGTEGVEEAGVEAVEKIPFEGAEERKRVILHFRAQL